MDDGFSLIELIVVIAIIGIISLIAMPNYTAIQNKAKVSALTTAGHTLQSAIESYAISNGSYPSGEGLNGGELFALLTQSGDVKTIPKNPYTGQSFAAGDTAGKIAYSYDSTTQTYEIKLYGETVSSPSVTLSN